MVWEGEIKKVTKVRKDGKWRKREAEGVRVKECAEHVRMERWMEGCRRSMAHNVTPDIAETEINTLSVSLQENWKVSPSCFRIQTVTSFLQEVGTGWAIRFTILINVFLSLQTTDQLWDCHLYKLSHRSVDCQYHRLTAQRSNSSLRRSSRNWKCGH